MNYVSSCNKLSIFPDPFTSEIEYSAYFNPPGPNITYNMRCRQQKCNQRGLYC